jgi:CRISPR-associated protein Cas1
VIKRIVEVTRPAKLSLRERQLLVEMEGEELGTVPLEDLGLLILDSPVCRPSQALLAECANRGVVILLSDEKHLPNSLVLPLHGNSLHSRVLAGQAASSPGVRNRLWARVVRAKINGQATVLDLTGDDGAPLRAIAGRVRSGDPDNTEGRAAQAYWKRLFGEDFLRDRDAPGINALLNYGYAVMRATVARAIVGTGLHPGLGIHHRNQYDPLPLADDLMEPLRPLVDLRVWLLRQAGGELELDRATREAVLELLVHPCEVGQRSFPLMTAMHSYAAEVKRMLLGEQKSADLPRLRFEELTMT